MYFGKVIGTVICTRKDRGLSGQRFLVVQRTNHRGEAVGTPIVAVDYMQSRRGDFICYVKSKDAALPLNGSRAPVDAGIVGLIDEVCFRTEKENGICSSQK